MPLRVLDLLRPAVITGVLLSLISYAMDVVMRWFGTTASRTVLNDLIIGILGSVAVFSFLLANYRKQNFENAKKRMLMIGELNLRIRHALIAVADSAMSEDRLARLRSMDEAVEEIDVIFCNFSTSQMTGSATRSV